MEKTQGWKVAMWALSRHFPAGLQLRREDPGLLRPVGRRWAAATRQGESLTHLEVSNVRPVQVRRHLKRRDYREKVRTRAGPALTL